jgi:acyl-CoA hydrolase/GNAT superfamily N-acetyltransferase
MTWQERYRDRVVPACDAIAAIPRGRRILIGSGAAEPDHLVQALVDHGSHLAQNEIVHLLTLGPAPYVREGLEQRFRHTALFIGKNVREAVHAGRADFMPVFLSEIPALIRSRRLRIDVALVQITPPDRFGFASLGASVDVVRAAVDCADLVIAQVNAYLPHTLGDAFVDVSRIRYLVPHDAPLPELPREPPDAEACAIARHVASLIPDGATLQMGIGGIPDAVLAQLSGHNDLGVHTEMFSDGAMELAERGVITGRRKTLLPGKMVTSFVMGSRALYAWVDDNPRVEFRPSEFTNDPFVIARNDQMIAINSALAVDLTGQVAADTLMGRFFSGIGGQVDFIRGAARSRGGKPIICLRSTAKEGTVSRIQPAFEEGAGVVTSRGDVRFVVTEFGVADLWGRSIRQRAMALIEIAHPDFRGDLLAAAKKRRYVFSDQVAPRRAYPWEEPRPERLMDGRSIVIRPARITDEDALRRLFSSMGDDDTEPRRVFRLEHLTHQEIQRLVDLDVENEMLLVAVADAQGAGDLVAVAEYRLDPATGLARIGFAVDAGWRLQGLGTLLMTRLTELARARGIRGLTATVHRSNRPMLSLFEKSGLPTATQLGDDGQSLHVVATLRPGSPADSTSATPDGRVAPEDFLEKPAG